MINDRRQAVDSTEKLKNAITAARHAAKSYSSYTQEEVDRIFHAAASAACRERIRLAKLAVEETGMGIVEDKVIKNHYASEYIYNAFKDTPTCGIIEEDKATGVMKVAEPLGVIAAVIPTTNPTSTAIFKALIALKTRNAVIFSPHPRAKCCTAEAARVVLETAVAAGAPEGIINWIDTPSLELSSFLMKEADVILATGGPAMVRAAYSSGKPALGVGAGNTPVIIDDSADIELAVSSIIHSKTFDNGVICASEQSVIALDGAYSRVKKEFIRRGCYFLKGDELDKVRKTIIINDALNAKIVGQSAHRIAVLAGIDVPSETKLLIGEVSDVSDNEEFAREKLSPVLALYRASDFETAIDMAVTLIAEGGYGHTASLYINTKAQKQRLDAFSNAMKACRIVINTPASHGAIGDLYNMGLTPSLTLGCGSWGGNSVCENVGVKHLVNIKTVAERRDNMLWFRLPQNIFLSRGCLISALESLKGKKRAFIVTDRFLYNNGYVKRLTDKLSSMDIEYTVFFDVMPDPTLASAEEGARQMRSFEPDCIIALGGGSPMDAAKIMWLLYEHPDADFSDMAMRFADIRKRIYSFPKMGERAIFVAIPTTSGTGSEVTPFAVITDGDSGVKYPLADYELMPDIAIIDPELTDTIPKELAAASGIDAMTHALEAYSSMLATDYTDAMALHAIKLLFEYLPAAYERGESDPFARERVANAATIAGIAFANAFLGICHSMAHKLGAFFHLPHGIANALLIEEVMKFNASEQPKRMGSFPQYTHPHALRRYAGIAEHIGLSGKNDKEKFDCLINALSELKKRLGIKNSISAYGIKESDFVACLDKMTEQAFDDQCTGANPRYPLMSEIKQIYLNAFYSKEEGRE